MLEWQQVINPALLLSKSTRNFTTSRVLLYICVNTYHIHHTINRPDRELLESKTKYETVTKIMHYSTYFFALYT